MDLRHASVHPLPPRPDDPAIDVAANLLENSGGFFNILDGLLDRPVRFQGEPREQRLPLCQLCLCSAEDPLQIGYERANDLILDRVAQGLKQKDVALQIDVGPTYLSQVETGLKPNPSLKVLRNLAKVLKCELFDFFDSGKYSEDHSINQLMCDLATQLENQRGAVPPLREIVDLRLIEKEAGPARLASLIQIYESQVSESTIEDEPRQSAEDRGRAAGEAGG